MSNTKNKEFTYSSNDKAIIHLPIEEGFTCLRGLSPKKLRFEVEYSLGHGTTSNTFIFTESNDSGLISKAILINPPGANFEEVFLPALSIKNSWRRDHVRAIQWSTIISK